MNEDIVKKWIIKAENDLKTGRDEQASVDACNRYGLLSHAAMR